MQYTFFDKEKCLNKITKLGDTMEQLNAIVLFEISSLGWRFTFARFALNIVVVFAIAFLIEKLLTDIYK